MKEDNKSLKCFSPQETKKTKSKHFQQLLISNIKQKDNCYPEPPINQKSNETSFEKYDSKARTSMLKSKGRKAEKKAKQKKNDEEQEVRKFT